MRRRADRLVPALSVAVAGVVIMTLLLATIKLARAVPVAAFWSETFLSNFYFLNRFDSYWNPEQLSNPLLHTWSLGVEFQIYLLLPLLFLWTRRPAGRPGSTVSTRSIVVGQSVVALASLALFLYLTSTSSRPFGFDAKGLAFYLPITRLWEVLLGSLASTMTSRVHRRFDSTSFRFFVFSLTLVVVGTFISNRVGTISPALILCCLGALGLIMNGTGRSRQPALARLGQPFIWIGDRSYSIYLWHWPLLALCVWRFPGSARAVIAAVIAAMILGALSYRFLETPSSRTRRTSNLRLVGSLTAALIVVVSVQGVSASAWFNRQIEMPVFGSGLDDAGLVGATMTDAIASCEQAEGATHCTNNPDTDREVIIIGDSLAYRAFPAVQLAAEQQGLNASMIWAGGCGVEFRSCPASVYEYLTSHDVAALIIAMNFDRPANRVNGVEVVVGQRPICSSDKPTADCGAHIQAVQQFREQGNSGLEELLNVSDSVLLALPFPQQAIPFPDCLSARYDSTSLNVQSQDAQCGGTSTGWQSARQGNFPAAIRDLAASFQGIEVWDPMDYFCDDGWCPAVLDSGEMIFTDSIHWSLEASRFIYPPLNAFIGQTD